MKKQLNALGNGGTELRAKEAMKETVATAKQHSPHLWKTLVNHREDWDPEILKFMTD